MTTNLSLEFFQFILKLVLPGFGLYSVVQRREDDDILVRKIFVCYDFCWQAVVENSSFTVL
jgi:hypothetical protein